MALKVFIPDLDNVVRERCCMCRAPTRYWHRSDVALCPLCAVTTRRADLPTKREWWDREMALDRIGRKP